MFPKRLMQISIYSPLENVSKLGIYDYIYNKWPVGLFKGIEIILKRFNEHSSTRGHDLQIPFRINSLIDKTFIISLLHS